MNPNLSLAPYALKNTVPPFYNVNQHQVNIDASNWPGGFSSNETSLKFGLPAMRNNVQAAAASALQRGGGTRKTLRRKIKNIAKQYRMPKRRYKTMKRQLKRKFMKLKGGYIATKKQGKREKKRSSSQRGGTYHQYGSQIPNTPSYSTGGMSYQVGANNSALANPVPFQRIGSDSQFTNCTDNYKHTPQGTSLGGRGFQFW
uniref:Uncharacterized protein n=1 Tax=viral metagenome TaxID=1070528 RepID=A0A6C0LCV0_9ZZZZ